MTTHGNLWKLMICWPWILETDCDTHTGCPTWADWFTAELLCMTSMEFLYLCLRWQLCLFLRASVCEAVKLTSDGLYKAHMFLTSSLYSELKYVGISFFALSLFLWTCWRVFNFCIKVLFQSWFVCCPVCFRTVGCLALWCSFHACLGCCGFGVLVGWPLFGSLVCCQSSLCLVCWWCRCFAWCVLWWYGFACSFGCCFLQAVWMCWCRFWDVCWTCRSVWWLGFNWWLRGWSFGSGLTVCFRLGLWALCWWSWWESWHSFR